MTIETTFQIVYEVFVAGHTDKKYAEVNAKDLRMSADGIGATMARTAVKNGVLDDPVVKQDGLKSILLVENTYGQTQVSYWHNSESAPFSEGPAFNLELTKLSASRQST